MREPPSSRLPYRITTRLATSARLLHHKDIGKTGRPKQTKNNKSHTSAKTRSYVQMRHVTMTQDAHPRRSKTPSPRGLAATNSSSAFQNLPTTWAANLPGHRPWHVSRQTPYIEERRSSNSKCQPNTPQPSFFTKMGSTSYHPAKFRRQ
ncbi:hypothetical protein Nepgr_021657 [Nepenthes gracilis]|uniref:Uncharacterized protein n=1 Tax=Nepenthes gracilis TaxID=150966 RepID=A0AAD3XXL0_NEPGR|nr:hypothetical protein Nepgr_021657 [Nepenthes gracilis]